MEENSDAARAWAKERNRLVGIAYRMLGDYGAAEDVVSDVALEAVRAERRDTGADTVPRSWPAWLTTVCVRRSIDRLRQVQALREEYPGPWLPEPVSTAALPEEVIANRELLSLAVLHLAEQLSPETRAAIVLHRAFAMPAPEIAEMLGTSPVAVRQLISRGERRLQIDDDRALVPTDVRALRDTIDAIESGDVSAVFALLSDDAVLWTDGGGRVKSALNPVFGPERIERFFVGILEKSRNSGAPLSVQIIEFNGEWGLSLDISGVSDVIAFEYRADSICGIRRVSNPEKLIRAFAQDR